MIKFIVEFDKRIIKGSGIYLGYGYHPLIGEEQSYKNDPYPYHLVYVISINGDSSKFEILLKYFSEENEKVILLKSKEMRIVR